ncbi:MAG TPA: nicotinate-nucleotide adenylyltransferase [Rubrobacteraceae bacterium]|nr:nicotinate-nucleotide adenylyltransferase [Rubrobacteraceae bacterium]
MTRVGIFGGTFDPIHQGHLVIAEQVAQTLGLACVIFVPGGVPPHKPASSIKASARDRLGMVETAIEGNDRFFVDRVEIDAGRPMYSVETVPLIKERHKGDEWFFVAGADEVSKLLSWKEPDKLLEETVMVAATRPGYDVSKLDHLAEALENFDKIIPVECTLMDISASGIRRMLAEGKSIRYLVPDRVHEIIYDRGLYGARRGKESSGSEGSLSGRNEA